MSTAGETTAVTDAEQAVVDYLLAHPDFFERHADLLATLSIQHASGSAVSLVERQLGLLRGKGEQLRTQLQQLITVARENEVLHDRLHRLTLALLDARDLAALQDILRRELQAHFQADAVALRQAPAEELQRPPDPGQSGARLLRELIATGKPRCGPLGEAELAYFFGADATGSRSVALIPLFGPRLTGALAIGSNDPERFHPGKATDFLTRLGEVVAKTVQVVAPAEPPGG
jgi:uncharacterized protein YigA (DUF484 family)